MKTLFEPHLVLSREPDGEYTLHAVTVTPNGCYGAGRAERGVPPNVRLVHEVEPVLLHITHRDGFCTQALKPVRHCLADLALGQAAGKTTLTAFAMVDGKIVGSSSIDVSQLGRVEVGQGKDKPTPIDVSDFYAWVDKMPPGPASFHVAGIVTMPTPGYDVSLVYASPQGINPRDLILDLQIRRRPGVWPQVVTPIPVRYDVETGASNYTSVLVRLPDGTGITLQVDEIY
jgi:hypothetical protein